MVPSGALRMHRGTMKLNKIVATVAIAITSIFGLAAAAGLASAATRPPVIYNDSNGWLTPQIRPAWILVGQGGSPMAHTWHWNTWNSKAAKSTGTLVTNNCIPNCAYGRDTDLKFAMSEGLTRAASGGTHDVCGTRRVAG